MMELQSLQSQLKSAIQSHQIVLSKMRIDPQNTALQKQLHDLQAEIKALSDKQKQVVQQLRLDLERKNSTVLKLSHNPQVLPHSMLSSPVKLRGTLKGGGTALLLPNLVVVPGGADGPRGDLLLAPPIRVPQYPPTPPCLAPAPQRNNLRSTAHSHHLANTTSRVPKTTSCVTVVVATDSRAPSCVAAQVEPTSPLALNAVSTMCSSPGHSTATTLAPPQRTKPSKEDNNKMEFMRALGLMTQEALNELQNRRGERKRRTTANPHFSSAALEEKRKNAAIIAELTGKGRHKGRLRLGSTTPTSSHPGSPEASSNDTAVTANGHSTPPLSASYAVKKEEDRCSPPNRDWGGPGGPVGGGSPIDWVSDYALLKGAKAEEKQKLLKRSLELKSERMQLEEKKQQLSEIIANQQKRRVELQAALQTIQAAVEKLESVVQCFKDSS